MKRGRRQRRRWRWRWRRRRCWRRPTALACGRVAVIVFTRGWVCRDDPSYGQRRRIGRRRMPLRYLQCHVAIVGRSGGWVHTHRPPGRQRWRRRAVKRARGRGGGSCGSCSIRRNSGRRRRRRRCTACGHKGHHATAASCSSHSTFRCCAKTTASVNTLSACIGVRAVSIVNLDLCIVIVYLEQLSTVPLPLLFLLLLCLCTGWHKAARRDDGGRRWWLL